jgi:hypothetical protein
MSSFSHSAELYLITPLLYLSYPKIPNSSATSMIFLPQVRHCSFSLMLWLEYEMCPFQAHVLNTWLPAGGTILGGGGNFTMWGLVGGSRSLGVCL